MNVLFRFDASAALEKRLAALCPSGVTLSQCPESDEQRYRELLSQADTLWHVLTPVTEEAIGRAPRLKLIQKIGVGVNTIALEAARGRGVAVCNLPGTNSRAVAEMALLLMLACLRRLPALSAAMREATAWQHGRALQDFYGELGGRTVGLVGFGAVPRLLAPMLLAMGARVVYTSRTRKADAPCAWRTLEQLLAESDIVSLHVPLDAGTEHMIDPRRMKAGAILINTARGALVEEAALIEALRTGHLAGAGLDVFETEPLNASSELARLPGVVATPHVAWLTRETLERSFAVAFDNLRRLEAGLPLLHRVI